METKFFQTLNETENLRAAIFFHEHQRTVYKRKGKITITTMKINQDWAEDRIGDTENSNQKGNLYND